jgi:hypothetical protein
MTKVLILNSGKKTNNNLNKYKNMQFGFSFSFTFEWNINKRDLETQGTHLLFFAFFLFSIFPPPP